MRIVKQNSLLNILYSTAVQYPAPANITYFWNFGIFALVCLMIQIITGILLTMHYASNVEIAFNSVEHIMRDVNYGWLLRYVHANGASIFFIVVYIHLFRGLYYGSFIYPREFLWCSGVIILLLMILTAFMGYILPWGQMSFWGATVITNLASTIPVIGDKIVVWLWGGFAVANPTLNRFLSLHYLLPFVLLGLTLLHVVFLHEFGSSNPLGINFKVDQIPFTPYFTIKDLYSVIVFLMFFSIFVFFIPNVLGHPDNYIPANSESTPEHIVPEWYFLPFYAILRAIPDKLGGFIALLLAILVLLTLPFLNNSNIRSSQFRPLYRIGFWFFFVDTLILGWIGAKPIEHPYLIIGQVSTVFYFGYLLILIPLINYLERKLYSSKL